MLLLDPKSLQMTIQMMMLVAGDAEKRSYMGAYLGGPLPVKHLRHCTRIVGVTHALE
jgi:hypothetical protein